MSPWISCAFGARNRWKASPTEPSHCCRRQLPFHSLRHHPVPDPEPRPNHPHPIFFSLCLGGPQPTTTIVPCGAAGVKSACVKPSPGVPHRAKFAARLPALRNCSRHAVATAIGKAIDQQCSLLRSFRVATAAWMRKHPENQGGQPLSKHSQHTLNFDSEHGKAGNVDNKLPRMECERAKKNRACMPSSAYLSCTAGLHFTRPHFSTKKSCMY